MQGGLARYGVSFVHDSAEAEVLIINTCGFIESAKEESIDTILQAVELKKRSACRQVFVTGCLSERYGKELAKEIPGVDGFFGNRDVQKIVAGLAKKMRLRHELLGEFYGDGKRTLLTPRHYAYLKISEGCEHPCTFCAIPGIRGKFRSQPMPALMREARSLAAQGVRELILIAQDTTIYHDDLDGVKRLPELLRQLCTIDGIEWIRLMYAYPYHVTDELLEVIAEEEKICNYIDMPIQHISSRLLKRMARRVDRKFTEELIERMRRRIPNLALRTSLIVGFPGETEEDFQELLDFVEGANFERLGVFTYSQEDGTPSAIYADQVAFEIIRERHEFLTQTQAAVAAEWSARQVGKVLRVLVDESNSIRQRATARTEWDCPEIDHAVVLPQAVAAGNFYDVEITGASDFELEARLLKGANHSRAGLLQRQICIPALAS
jgi:ribosomal protein S12 methylthiotransferase